MSVASYLNLTECGDSPRELHTLVMANVLTKKHANQLTSGLGISHPKLTAITKQKKADPVDWQSAEYLISCAKAAHALSTKGVSDENIGKWLQAPCAALKQKVPLDLLQTYPGTEYVMTAISRM